MALIKEQTLAYSPYISRGEERVRAGTGEEGSKEKRTMLDNQPRETASFWLSEKLCVNK